MRTLSACVFLVISALHLVRSQVPAYGVCPDVTVEEDFDINKYMGKWYEYARYPFVSEDARKCSVVYYEKDDRKTITIWNESVDR